MDVKNITVNKQSSIRIEGSKILYFDPFQIEKEQHDADYIFVTHEHYDHFDPASIQKIKSETTVLVVPESMKKKALAESGIEEKNCVFLAPGTVRELDGLLVETVPAYNKLKPFHTKLSKWLGYIVKLDDTRYFVAGDTDVNEDNKNVKSDVALIPIGGHFTMDKMQAAVYVLEMRPKVVIPTHYGDLVGAPADGEEFKSLVESKDNAICVKLKL